MIKIVKKSVHYSNKVNSAFYTTLCNNNEIIIEHNVQVKVTFKDWWNFFIGKDCLHLTCNTTLTYEEINSSKPISDNTSNNTTKFKTPKPKKGKSDTSIGEQSADIK